MKASRAIALGMTLMLAACKPPAPHSPQVSLPLQSLMPKLKSRLEALACADTSLHWQVSVVPFFNVQLVHEPAKPPSFCQPSAPLPLFRQRSRCSVVDTALPASFLHVAASTLPACN